MNLLSADKLSKSFSEKWLFDEISFGLSKGGKIALVGHNGCGKSTLLKILSGQMEPDKGGVALMTGVRIGYLPQEPNPDPEKTIEEELFGESNPVSSLVKQYEKLILEENPDPNKMENLMNQMEAMDAWEYEKKTQKILSRLGITNLQQKQDTLSGGQKKRVALAALLVSSPDILLLDEPTNHLDLQAIEWLESLLNAHNTSLIMVTHDRYFLDNVADSILEIDRGKLYKHEGKYSTYLDNKLSRELARESELSKASNLLKKELEWMRKMPKARGTKAKGRIEAFHQLQDDVSNLKVNKKELDITVKSERLGNKIIEMDAVSLAYDEKVIVKDFSYIFKKNDRIGIIGPNGAGKTSFLDLLTHKVQADSGSIVHGPTLKIGYYTQHSHSLNESNRIIDEVREIAEYVTLGNGETVSVSKLLDMFLFPPGVQHTPISKLSGGERRRLQLLKVLTANPNFLILDEPTNDLDTDTLNVLEDFLANFGACLVLVSHDRYFMDRLTEHLFVIEGEGHIRDFYGNYTDYRDQVEDEKEEEDPKPQTTEKPVAASAAKPVKLSYKEQREYEELEKEMEELEKKKSELNGKLNSGSNDHTDLMNWSQEIESINERLDEAGMRWLELSERT